MKVTYRQDYKKPNFDVRHVALEFFLDNTSTRVINTMEMERLEGGDLVLNGRYLKLLSILLNGKVLPTAQYQQDEESLTITDLPSSFTLTIETQINPQANTRLMGLYVSGGLFCTQCEPEGFRAITYYLDHPDVMSLFDVTVHADRKACPVVLSNGNLIKDSDETVIWHDPFKKPSYLFALVAGDLAHIEDSFQTMSGRHVTLRIYCEPSKKERLSFAMDSLKRAMKWDEEKFGREYDLDAFNIVAVKDFNAGAMENKSLNIFNDQLLLADPMTATDANYETIEGVIAHEYFHNWSGDRVTARDWFNLSLKEGFTVYRDQEFSADQRSHVVKRIDDVDILKNYQFPEDDGPLAHPVRPESFATIENFYTATVYDKGAELIRMQEKILGYDGFHKGCDLYFTRHDGQAVTIDDFVKCMADANKVDMTAFMQWYSTAGRPTVTVHGVYDTVAETYVLTLSQHSAFTDTPFVIPLAIGLVGHNGQDIVAQTLLMTQKEQTFTFHDIKEKPVLSINRGFSAPVTIKIKYTDEERLHLMAYDLDDFNRYDIGQHYATDEILKMVAHQTVASSAFLDAFGAYLNKAETDPAFVARAIALPAAGYIGEQMDVFDVDGVLNARRALRTAFAVKYRDSLRSIYDRLNDGAPYCPDAISAGKRALKNAALGYLALTEDKDIVLEAYQKADNMTDLMAALASLVHNQLDNFDEALADFYTNYQHDYIVMNKWFGLQAMADIPHALDRVKKLENNPSFDKANPNNVRALVGGFTHNLRHFHAKDGSGYAYLSDWVIALNHTNPSLAERILHPLTRLKRFDAQRRLLMKNELERILQTSCLSVNVQETLQRTLKEV